MSGWNHTLRPYTDEELAEWEEREAKLNARDDNGKSWVEWREKRGHYFWTECSAPKCKERPVFHATYDYITGRAGRVSYARKEYCREHGERFAAKHGLVAAAVPGGEADKP